MDTVNTITQPTSMPPINFAPVFKIVNGGSDFSTDGQANPMTGGNNLGDAALGISSTTAQIDGGKDIKFKQDGGAAKEEEKKQSGGSSIWDWTNMLIKKV